MRATIPIALQPGTRVLRLERAAATASEPGYWMLWLHHDQRLTQGTFIRLYDNGSIEHVTTDQDGVEQTYWVKHHE